MAHPQDHFGRDQPRRESGLPASLRAHILTGPTPESGATSPSPEPPFSTDTRQAVGRNEPASPYPSSSGAGRGTASPHPFGPYQRHSPSQDPPESPAPSSVSPALSSRQAFRHSTPSSSYPPSGRASTAPRHRHTPSLTSRPSYEPQLLPGRSPYERQPRLSPFAVPPMARFASASPPHSHARVAAHPYSSPAARRLASAPVTPWPAPSTQELHFMAGQTTPTATLGGDERHGHENMGAVFAAEEPPSSNKRRRGQRQDAELPGSHIGQRTQNTQARQRTQEWQQEQRVMRRARRQHQFYEGSVSSPASGLGILLQPLQRDEHTISTDPRGMHDFHAGTFFHFVDWYGRAAYCVWFVFGR
jgi:hypothetical protein